MKSDVHTRHCCKHHGCKYDDPDCSVFYGPKEAEYECEICIEEPDTAKDNLSWLYSYYHRLETENKLPQEYRNIYNELLALKLKV
jgi:disulfide oxidoreductase YuzD